MTGHATVRYMELAKRALVGLRTWLVVALLIGSIPAISMLIGPDWTQRVLVVGWVVVMSVVMFNLCLHVNIFDVKPEFTRKPVFELKVSKRRWGVLVKLPFSKKAMSVHRNRRPLEVVPTQEKPSDLGRSLD